MSKLKVGQTVSWRGNFGSATAQDAVVKSIEVNCVGKNGTPVNSVKWDKVDSRNVIVDLTNGSWAYGTQISKKDTNVYPTFKKTLGY